jgi:hypothetical protein
VDIREFTTYNEKSPITGYGVWIVLEAGRRAHLLHPVNFSELIITEYEFHSSSGRTIWPVNATGCPFNASRFMESFKKRIAFFMENGRPFPLQSVAKAIAGLEDISFDEALDMIRGLAVDEKGNSLSVSRSSDKVNRIYRLDPEVDLDKFYGRPRVILQAIKESGPISIYKLTSLVEGKLVTKTDKNRVVTYFVNKLASQGILEIVA